MFTDFACFRQRNSAESSISGNMKLGIILAVLMGWKGPSLLGAGCRGPIAKVVPPTYTPLHLPQPLLLSGLPCLP